jgi:hypothetical protein
VPGNRDAADVVLRLRYHSDCTFTDSLPGEHAHVPTNNNSDERDLPIQKHLLTSARLAGSVERLAARRLAGWPTDGSLADKICVSGHHSETRRESVMSASQCAAIAARSQARPPARQAAKRGARGAWARVPTRARAGPPEPSCNVHLVCEHGRSLPGRLT